MNARLSIVLAVTALTLMNQPVMGEKNAEVNLDHLVVDIDGAEPPAAKARESLPAGLSALTPKPKQPPRTVVNKQGCYVLYGDLFKTGGCFALLEIPPAPGGKPGENTGSVALAEWEASDWKLGGLWNIEAIWRDPQAPTKPDDYLPIAPTSRPFQIEDFSGDHVPEVLIAGEVHRYYQVYYLLRFDPETRRLRLVASSMARPERAGKFVRLYSNSGRRSTFENWEFLEWSGKELVSRFQWHEETPYYQPEEPFISAEVTDQDGRKVLFRIVDSESGYEITRDGHPFARIAITWKDQASPRPPEGEAIENGWLFEKLTGLPRKLYPRLEPGTKSVRLEKVAKIRVDGGPDASRLLLAP